MFLLSSWLQEQVLCEAVFGAYEHFQSLLFEGLALPVSHQFVYCAARTVLDSLPK